VTSSEHGKIGATIKELSKEQGAKQEGYGEQTRLAEKKRETLWQK